MPVIQQIELWVQRYEMDFYVNMEFEALPQNDMFVINKIEESDKKRIVKGNFLFTPKTFKFMLENEHILEIGEFCEQLRQHQVKSLNVARKKAGDFYRQHSTNYQSTKATNTKGTGKGRARRVNPREQEPVAANPQVNLKEIWGLRDEIGKILRSTKPHEELRKQKDIALELDANYQEPKPEP